MMPYYNSRNLEPWQVRFLAMLPVILGSLRVAFRHLRSEAKAEAVQEGLAGAYAAYARLVERGRENLAFATVLAGFAARQVRVGRRIGGRLSKQDISSEYAQRARHLKLERLDRYNPREGCWLEAVVEDPKTPIPDQVAFRIDFSEWLESLPPRDRQIAEALAEGHRTKDVASRFRLTLGRVSQLRAKFYKSWLAFHGESEGESESGRLLCAA